TFAGVPFQDAVDFATKVEAALAPDCPNATLAQKSIRWILDHPQVSTVIPGARSPRQAIDNTVPTYLPELTKESHTLLAELYGTKIAPKVRGVY
ncbi:MAG: aldo/keto reductase, partial [Verrucomicrobiales bacterium]|nr:aldo/keto reductase [Verrucomicrobiales bacterium]